MVLGVEWSAVLVIGLFGDLQQIRSAFSPLPSPATPVVMVIISF